MTESLTIYLRVDSDASIEDCEQYLAEMKERFPGRDIVFLDGPLANDPNLQWPKA